MAMNLDSAVEIAKAVRGTNGEYTLPKSASVGDVAEALHVIQVGLSRYRKLFTAFSEDAKMIEEGK